MKREGAGERSESKRPTRRELLRAGAWGALGSLPLLGSAEYGTGWLELSRQTLRLPRWHAGRTRIALIADLHAHDRTNVDIAIRAVNMVLEEKPDVIVLAGDFISYAPPDRLARLREILRPIGDSRIPAFGVLGNHDHWTGYPIEVRRHVEQAGIPVLADSTASVGDIQIVGINDALAGGYSLDRIDWNRLSRSTVCLWHEPDAVLELPKDKVSVQLSGHSHGGQICLPGGIPIHLPKGGRRFYRGYYEDAPTPLFVTRGTGTTGPNWRLFCRPEVSILDVDRA
jgi:predicted MPP superfamily phosphohydrolase